MTPYELVQLAPDLVLIRWSRSPTAAEGYDFIQALHQLMDAAAVPQYFISDLRKGRITQADILQRLGQVTTHANWAGSTAFGGGFASKVYVGLFDRLRPTRTAAPEIWPHADEALAYLEKLKPGLTAGIDWQTVLG